MHGGYIACHTCDGLNIAALIALHQHVYHIVERLRIQQQRGDVIEVYALRLA